MSNLFRAVWESDERKSIEREITANLERLNARMNEMVEKVRADKVATNLKQGVKEAWETAHGPQILNEMQAGLADVLHKLNEEIAKRAQPAQEVKPGEGSAQQTANGEPVGMSAAKPE
ncbi:hypothetical protein [Candidatus Roseilinea sp. NK_OTU-006]|uniref:hypothetical protein n=1 Tax=Candidatus Roseilinea sp. NK_OTU-006 TaxID=2704250 RepID=UPI00145C95DB|nr:hypothetical protein [Candidatus Roseilinea sp. NK_OTU-006]